MGPSPSHPARKNNKKTYKVYMPKYAGSENILRNAAKKKHIFTIGIPGKSVILADSSSVVKCIF